MREGGVRSVHFPPAAEPGPRTRKPEPKPDLEPAPETNILEVFANAHRDTELIRERLRGLLTTQSRHGDLQAAYSAVKRLADNIQILIEHEEA